LSAGGFARQSHLASNATDPLHCNTDHGCRHQASPIIRLISPSPISHFCWHCRSDKMRAMHGQDNLQELSLLHQDGAAQQPSS
jgi:hypothetical protein